jgi:hypothetical protein
MGLMARVIIGKDSQGSIALFARLEGLSAFWQPTFNPRVWRSSQQSPAVNVDHGHPKRQSPEQIQVHSAVQISLHRSASKAILDFSQIRAFEDHPAERPLALSFYSCLIARPKVPAQEGALEISGIERPGIDHSLSMKIRDEGRVHQFAQTGSFGSETTVFSNSFWCFWIISDGDAEVETKRLTAIQFRAAGNRGPLDKHILSFSIPLASFGMGHGAMKQAILACYTASISIEIQTLSLLQYSANCSSETTALSY